MYVDTSCLVAFYAPEAGTETANSIIVQAQKVHISTLTQVEFISALNKKMRTGTLSKAEVEMIIAEFEKQINKRMLTSNNFEAHHFEQAAAFLKRTSLPLLSLDALHLSICFLENFQLFTFNDVLAKAATEFGVKLVNYSG